MKYTQGPCKSYLIRCQEWIAFFCFLLHTFTFPVPAIRSAFERSPEAEVELEPAGPGTVTPMTKFQDVNTHRKKRYGSLAILLFLLYLCRLALAKSRLKSLS